MTTEDRPTESRTGGRDSGSNPAADPARIPLSVDLFVEKAAVAIILTDEEGTVREWNPAAEQLTGIQRDRVVGRPVWEVQATLVADGPTADALAQAIRSAVHEAGRTGLVPSPGEPTERRTRRADGVEITIEQRMFAVPTPRGHWLCAILVDVTERRRADRLLELQRDLGIALAGAGDVREALEQALRVVLQIEHVDSGGVYAVDVDRGGMDLVASVGLSEAYAAHVGHYDRGSPEWQITEAAVPYYGPDDRLSPELGDATRREGMRAMGDIPVSVEGRVIALLAVGSRSVPEFPPATRKAVETIATQVGSALVRIEARQSLRAAEERYRILVEDIAEGAGFVDLDRRFVAANAAAETIFGVPAHGLVGRSLDEFATPEARREILRQAAQRRAGRRGTYEMDIVRPDGEPRTIVVRASPHYDANNVFDGSFGVFSDVTEQRRAEDALRQRDADLRRAQEVARIGSFRRDVGTGEEWWSDELYRIYGVAGASEVPTWEWVRSLHDPESNAAMIEGDVAARVDGRPFDVYHRATLPDGSRHILHTLGEPELDEGGRPIRIVGTTQDVTESYTAEEALRQRESELRRAQRIAAVGSWVWDFRAGETRVTDELLRILGLPADAVVEMETIVAMAVPEDRSALLAAMDQVRQTGSGSVEARLRRADGTVVATQVGVEVERDRTGRMLRIAGTVQDITERRRAEEERHALEAQVLQTQKMESLGVLAGGIAHDFNNLLVAILGNAGLVRAALPPESPLRSTVEDMELAAQRAADLAGQMLAYSGRGRFVVETLDLNRVVAEMGRLLSASVPKRVLLRYELAPDLPPITGDVTQLRQVVMNLITNASDAIGDAEGVVTCRTAVAELELGAASANALTGQVEPGTYVSLSVADTGAGMDEATRVRIFEPFFTTRFTGRGLGLAAVLGILRGHGGTITVESTPGEGSTFTVFLPVAPAPRAVPDTQPGTPRDAGAGGVPGTRAEGVREEPVRRPDDVARSSRSEEATRGSAVTGTRDRGGTPLARVLVVDDEVSVRRLAGRVLEAEGYDVRYAADGREAVAAVRADPGSLDVVLLDLSMPRLGGDATLAEIKGIRADLPVLLTSGYHDHPAMQETPSAAGFVRKPYAPGDLVAAVAAALDAARRAGD